MKCITILVLTVLCLCLTESLSAQVPGIINYQGRVTVGGTNFTGTGQFKFALVNTGASQTYWSNGNSAVSLTITKGLYSVLLGDTNIPNMANSIPPTVFANPDVRLRVSFDSGSGPQQLAPDQRLASVGYVFQAQNANLAASANDALQLGGVSAASYIQTGQLAATSNTLASASVTAQSTADVALAKSVIASNLAATAYAGTNPIVLYTDQGVTLTNDPATPNSFPLVIRQRHGANLDNGLVMYADNAADVPPAIYFKQATLGSNTGFCWRIGVNATWSTYPYLVLANSWPGGDQLSVGTNSAFSFGSAIPGTLSQWWFGLLPQAFNCGMWIDDTDTTFTNSIISLLRATTVNTNRNAYMEFGNAVSVTGGFDYYIGMDKGTSNFVIRCSWPPFTSVSIPGTLTVNTLLGYMTGQQSSNVFATKTGTYASMSVGSATFASSAGAVTGKVNGDGNGLTNLTAISLKITNTFTGAGSYLTSDDGTNLYWKLP